MCWHSFIKQSHITTTPSRTSSFAAILKSSASFTLVEPCKQYRSTVEFNFIDSTVLINLGDPCKRAFTHNSKVPLQTTPTEYRQTSSRYQGAPGKLTIQRPFEPTFNFLNLQQGCPTYWRRVPQLQIIFKNTLSGVETSVYRHHISLFQWRLSAPYRLAPWAVARQVRPLARQLCGTKDPADPTYFNPPEISGYCMYHQA
jgi:hypothetical protein